MKLYRVYLYCRPAYDVNEYGVFGLQTAANHGLMCVAAQTPDHAISKAMEAARSGVEPHLVTSGGAARPATERFTADFACEEDAPFVE